METRRMRNKTKNKMKNKMKNKRKTRGGATNLKSTESLNTNEAALKPTESLNTNEAALKPTEPTLNINEATLKLNGAESSSLSPNPNDSVPVTKHIDLDGLINLILANEEYINLRAALGTQTNKSPEATKAS